MKKLLVIIKNYIYKRRMKRNNLLLNSIIHKL